MGVIKDIVNGGDSMTIETSVLSLFKDVSVDILFKLMQDVFDLPILKEKLIEAINTAFHQTCWTHQMEWNEQILTDFLNDNDSISIDDLLSITKDKMKEIMMKYPINELDDMSDTEKELYADGLELITEQWINETRDYECQLV